MQGISRAIISFAGEAEPLPAILHYYRSMEWQL